MRRPALSGAVATALVMLVVALGAGLAGYLTSGSTSHRSVAPAAEQASAVRGVVQSFDGNKLSLTTDSGSVDVSVPQDTRVEALRPATLAQVDIGDWLNAGAFANKQTVFTLQGLVVIPQSQLGQTR